MGAPNKIRDIQSYRDIGHEGTRDGSVRCGNFTWRAGSINLPVFRENYFSQDYLFSRLTPPNVLSELESKEAADG